MSRRLVNRSGQRATPAPVTVAVLPEYQPPSCPLDDVARRGIGELATDLGAAVYQTQLRDSLRFIGASVGDLHERLREQRRRVELQRSRREERGADKTEDEERLESHVADLESKVNALTDESEAAIRDLIDRNAELEDEGVVLNDLYTHVNTATAHTAAARHRARRRQDPDLSPEEEDEDEAKTPPPPSTIDLLATHIAEKQSAYTSLSMHERYALNNDYAAFKKLWHDAMAGEEGPPLPDASRWFRRDGQPVMRGAAQILAAGGISGEGDDDDDDDDIAVEREVLSVNCPLTLRPMDQPYSNRKCKHTFEKAAILDYLQMQGEHQCPQTGCSQMFSRIKFDEDFYLDQAMVRRIKRARQAQEQQDMEDDGDDDDGDDDQEVTVRGQKRRQGRMPKQERR
ncbi:hypothetical protein G7046_g7509 [Stylonectria norvegica]|nr:hypothetical protein G7046_g7509 [Stylonectria norvegica]